MRWLRAAVLVPLLALAVNARPVAADAVEGIGAFPLSDSVVSLWLLGSPQEEKRALLLVYFKGTPGWHDRRWETDFKINVEAGDRAYYRLVSGDVVLGIMLSSDLRTAYVQDRPFPLSENNTFMVLRADGAPDAQTVIPLGRTDLASRKDEPISVQVLRANPDIARRLVD